MKKKIIAFGLSLFLLLGQAGAVLSIEDARMLVEELYIDEVPQSVLESETVEELFAGLDPYSAYFPPKQYDNFLGTMNDTSVVGIGISSTFNEDGTALNVVQVFEDGSAYKKGLEAGDQILAVDGKKVSAASSLEEATNWIKGRKDTPVTLTIRKVDGRVFDVTMPRAPFTVSYTNYSLLDEHIGYISCQSFGEQTYDRFVKAVETLGGQADLWIVDLRDNTGGLTTAALNSVSIFTGNGVQSLLRNRAGEYYGMSASGNVHTMYPVIVLVNENSASASEQFAAAVRDKKAGIVIGSRTFGKGIAQTLVDGNTEPEMFTEGDAVKITSHRFYSPDGLINDVMGVLPHLMVDANQVENIARLLNCLDPQKDNQNVLRVHVGGWRFFIHVEEALEQGQEAALEELLEALLPETEVYWGTGNNKWQTISVAEAVERLELESYEARWFSDAEASPYRQALNSLKTYGILRGDEAGNCNPAGALTRAELCAMLAQALNTPKTARTNVFADVPEDAWYALAVNSVAAMGFVQGDGTCFYPEKVLTNEELMVVMSRVSVWMSINRYQKSKLGPEEGALESQDLAAYSDWAKEAAWLLGRAQRNYFGEYISYLWADVAEINPGAAATREETAYTLWRTLDMLKLVAQ